MLYSTLLVGVSIFASTFVSAQSNSTGGTPGDFTQCCKVVPTTVDSNLRLSWCRAQQNTCPETCQNGQTSANDCDPTALTFNCQCLKGTTPNITDYAQTLPSLECDEWKAQCTAAHPNDLSGQTFCQSFTCGKKNASAQASSASSSASSASGSSSASTTSGGAAAATSSKAASGTMVRVEYGAGILGLAFLALFCSL